MVDTGCAMVDGSAHKRDPDQEGPRRPCRGERDTQYYALPSRSGSQTAARVSITETHFHKMHPLFVPYSHIGTSHGCFRLDPDIFGLYTDRIQQPLAVFANASCSIAMKIINPCLYEGMCTAFGEWYRKETQKILNEKEK